jgi:hypothetical protein
MYRLGVAVLEATARIGNGGQPDGFVLVGEMGVGRNAFVRLGEAGDVLLPMRGETVLGFLVEIVEGTVLGDEVRLTLLEARDVGRVTNR